MCGATVVTILIGGCGGGTAASKSTQALTSPAADVSRAAVSSLAAPASPAPEVSLTAPAGPITVVGGARVTSGVQLGFPPSIVGAISAAAYEFVEAYGLDPAHEEVVGQLTADSSNPAFPQDAATAALNLRKMLGLSATGPVPAGYAVQLKAVEYQVRDLTADQVLVILLCEVTYVRPGSEAENTGVFPFLMHWEQGDWKNAGHTDSTYLKLLATPDSPSAAALGWNPLLY